MIKMQMSQQNRRSRSRRTKQLLWSGVILLTVLAAVLLITRIHGADRQTDSLSEAESTLTDHPGAVSTVSGAVNEETAEVSAVQPASQPPIQEKSNWDFQEVLLPQYIKDFLSENWEADYRNIITALYKGESSVQLTAISTQKEWEQMRRAVQLTFPPRALLYDAQYYNNDGPFSFDEKTGVLSIRYGWEQEIPSVADRDSYLLEVDAFRQNVTEIFDRYVTDVSDAESTAGELFDYVALTLRYDYDMKLNLYDAFTKHIAYCQTYSQMYQYLMWQAGYECWLYTGGNFDHEWNVIWLDGIPYHADATWQSNDDYTDRYFFAMSDEAAKATNHGSADSYMRTDVLLDSDERVYCTDRRFDEIYRKGI